MFQLFLKRSLVPLCRQLWNREMKAMLRWCVSEASVYFFVACVCVCPTFPIYFFQMHMQHCFFFFFSCVCVLNFLLGMRRQVAASRDSGGRALSQSLDDRWHSVNRLCAGDFALHSLLAPRYTNESNNASDASGHHFTMPVGIIAFVCNLWGSSWS